MQKTDTMYGSYHKNSYIVKGMGLNITVRILIYYQVEVRIIQEGSILKLWFNFNLKINLSQ
jgi:hypothetical protein